MGSAVKTKWVCKECGFESPGFLGRCLECGSWGSLVEKLSTGSSSTKKISKPKHGLFITAESDLQVLSDIPEEELHRIKTGFEELDRVLGGGIVPGSISLIGGSPGVGKSTLLLETCANLAESLSSNESSSKELKKHEAVLYISAEESSSQLKMRASRLGLKNQKIFIYAENNLEKIVDKINEVEPALVIVDSVQAIYLPTIDSIPGSVSQIRETTSNLTRLAKSTNIPIILVGHINKDGDIAGPKILEHVVDTVLQFEGEKGYSFRILRGIKNRFGSTDEIGIFEMTEKGIKDLKNPSELFLKQRSGGMVTATQEGNRCLLLELQALILDSDYHNPRRLANGIELTRLHQILAVMEKKIGLVLSKSDVYINVVGGLNIKEPAADLSMALTIYQSSFEERKTEKMNASENEPKDPNQDLIALGEIGLSGEIRAIHNLEARLKEAQKLGFQKAIVPFANIDTKDLRENKLKDKYGMDVIPVKTVEQAVNILKS